MVDEDTSQPSSVDGGTATVGMSIRFPNAILVTSI